MSSKEAQILANEQGVDLVEIAANANPPVVKIIDWGKFQYQKMRGFLDDGDRVKIMIVFRGREMAHKELGNELLSKVISLLGEDVVTEGKTQMSGRNLSVQVRKK